MFRLTNQTAVGNCVKVRENRELLTAAPCPTVLWPLGLPIFTQHHSARALTWPHYYPQINYLLFSHLKSILTISWQYPSAHKLLEVTKRCWKSCTVCITLLQPASVCLVHLSQLTGRAHSKAGKQAAPFSLSSKQEAAVQQLLMQYMWFGAQAIVEEQRENPPAQVGSVDIFSRKQWFIPSPCHKITRSHHRPEAKGSC